MTPPPHELDGLIRAARDVAGPPPDVAARLVERLDGAVAASTAAGGAGGAALSKTLLVLGGSALFVAGLLVGAGAVWTMRGAQVIAPIVAVVQTAAPMPPAPPALEPMPEPQPEQQAAVPVRPEAARPVERKPSQPPVAEASSTLEAERQLLDVARAAVMRGAWPEALEATEAHRAQFPTGALAEEREVLAIQALATTDPKAAAARAEAFRKKWPSSILEAVIEKVVPRDGSSASPQ